MSTFWLPNCHCLGIAMAAQFYSHQRTETAVQLLKELQDDHYLHETVHAAEVWWQAQREQLAQYHSSGRRRNLAISSPDALEESRAHHLSLLESLGGWFARPYLYTTTTDLTTGSTAPHGAMTAAELRALSGSAALARGAYLRGNEQLIYWRLLTGIVGGVYPLLYPDAYPPGEGGFAQAGHALHEMEKSLEHNRQWGEYLDTDTLALLRLVDFARQICTWAGRLAERLLPRPDSLRQAASLSVALTIHKPAEPLARTLYGAAMGGDQLALSSLLDWLEEQGHSVSLARDYLLQAQEPEATLTRRDP